MGAVYQAWDNTLEIAVAVKVIRPRPATDAATAETLKLRLKRELLLARQVTHRNVVRIHDLAEVDGLAYITMTYIQGSDLGTILRRDGRLPVARALALARHVASGLAAAHEVGVVHRDLKPGNIMVERDGVALITDFGLTRSMSDEAEIPVTAEGVIVGTVEYMAPEQAQGSAVDHRTDIYSFGLILNDMLLGRRQAGAGGGMAGMLSRMQRAPSSLRSVDATIPPWVDALVTKCLQPDPASRYSTIAEVLAELESLDRPDHAALTPQRGPAAGPQQTRTPAPRSVAAKRWVLGACILLELAVGGWAFRDRFLPGHSSIPTVVGEPTIRRAEVLLSLGDRSTARQEIERTLVHAETLGLRTLLVKAHYLRAEVLRLGGDSGARREYGVALRLVDEIRAEEGNQHLLKRADLGRLYAECERWSKGT